MLGERERFRRMKLDKEAWRALRSSVDLVKPQLNGDRIGMPAAA